MKFGFCIVLALLSAITAAIAGIRQLESNPQMQGATWITFICSLIAAIYFY